MNFFTGLKKLFPLLIVIGLVILLFAPALFSGKTLFLEDISYLEYPLQFLNYTMGKTGNLFFWNPHIFSGYPLTGYFYPLGVIFYLIPTGGAIVYFVLIHLILGAVFSYVYLKTLNTGNTAAAIGALIFALSGFLLSETRHFSILSASIYLPLILFCFDKKKEKPIFLTLGIIAFSFQILASAPQINYITAIVLFLRTIWELFTEKNINFKKLIESLYPFSIILVLGAGLSAFFIFPFYKICQFSPRFFHEGLSFVNTFPLKLQGMFSFFLPLFFSPIDECGVSNYYITIFAIPFLIASFFAKNKNRHFFIFLFIFSFLAALGDKGGINTLMALLLPFYTGFRAPVRFLLVTTFSIAVLSAFVMIFFENKKNWIITLIFMVICLELFLIGRKILPFTSEDFYKKPAIFTAIEKMEKESNLPVRCLTTPEVPFYYVNWTNTSNLSNITGYFPSILFYYLEYLWFNDRGKLPTSQDFEKMSFYSNCLEVTRLCTNMIQLLNLKYVITKNGKKALCLLKLENPGKRWFLTGDYEIIPDKEKLFTRLNSSEFDPFEKIIFQEDPRVAKVKNMKGEATLIQYIPDKIEFKINCDKPAFFFLSEIYFPGWKVKIDRKDSKIYRADYIFRAIHLDKGEHNVIFNYCPPYLREGILVSLLSIFILLVELTLRKKYAFNNYIA